MAAASKFKTPIRTVKQTISASEIVALGASTTGTIALGPSFDIPAGAMVVRATVANGGTAAATLATLTAQLGDSTDADQLIAAATVFAASAIAGGVPAAAFTSTPAAITALELLLTGDANLSTLTGLDDGLVVTVSYLEA